MDCDCGSSCPDGSCDSAVGEDCNSCPEDCGSDCCGDGFCDEDEDSFTCQVDCGACGDGAQADTPGEEGCKFPDVPFPGGPVPPPTREERFCEATRDDARLVDDESRQCSRYTYQGRVASLDSLFTGGIRNEPYDLSALWLEGAIVTLIEEHRDGRQVLKYSVTDEEGRFGQTFYWDRALKNKGNGPLFASPFSSVRININLRPRTAVLNGIEKPFFASFAEDLGVGNSGWGPNTIIGLTRQDVTLVTFSSGSATTVNEGCNFGDTTATLPADITFMKILDDGTEELYTKNYLVVALRDMGEEMNTYAVADSDSFMVPVGVLEIRFYDPDDGLRLMPQSDIDYSAFISPRALGLDLTDVGMFQLGPNGWSFVQSANVGSTTSTASGSSAGMINFDMAKTNPACVSIQVSDDWGTDLECGNFPEASFTVGGRTRNSALERGGVFSLNRIDTNAEAVIELGSQPVDGCPAAVITANPIENQISENTFLTGDAAGSVWVADCAAGQPSEVIGCRTCLAIKAEGTDFSFPGPPAVPVECGPDLHGSYGDIQECVDSLPEAADYFYMKEITQDLRSILSIDPGNRFVYRNNNIGELHYVHDNICEVAETIAAADGTSIVSPVISSQRRRILYGEIIEAANTADFWIYNLENSEKQLIVQQQGYRYDVNDQGHAHDISSYGDAAAIALYGYDPGNNPDGSDELFAFVFNDETSEYDTIQLTSASDFESNVHKLGRVEYLYTTGCDDCEQDDIKIGHVVGYASNLGLDGEFMKTEQDGDIIEFFVSYYRIMESGEVEIDTCQATTDGETNGVDVFRVTNYITDGDYDGNGFDDSIRERLDFIAMHMANTGGACPKLIAEEDQSKITNNGEENASVYFLMKVQYYDGSGWVDEVAIVNDAATGTKRKIMSGYYLPLDIPWNTNTIFGGWDTSTKIHDFGTYRAYFAATDENGIILRNHDNSLVEAAYEFTLSPMTLLEEVFYRIEHRIDEPFSDAEILAKIEEWILG